MYKRIFFWILVVLFLATAPLVIFYAIGYRFSPQRGIFIYTGSISIKSNPQNIEVFIDQELKNKNLSRLNNSYHIGGIKPGEHLIEVTSPGFNSWSKKITVTSGTSTEFWNVLLTKNNYEEKEYSPAGIENFFFDPGKKLIAYVQNAENKLSVNILDVSSAESENVFNSEEYKFTSDEKENIEWSPQSKKIVIPLVKDGEKNYLIVDIKTRDTVSLRELSGTDKMGKVRWDQNDKNFIYYLSEGNLHYLNTQKPEEHKIIAENISSYELSSSYVYYFQLPNGIVYRINSDGSGSPDQIITSAPDKMVDPSYQITVYDKDRVALLNKSGDLYIYNNGNKDRYFRNLSSGVKEIQFSNDGKKMLYWNDWEICAYFTRDWEVQPWRSENDQKEIVRFSEKINNIQWSRDYEHILFNVGDKIKIAELDNRSQKNVSDILILSGKNTKIVSDFGDNKLYFLDENGKIYSIVFPENEGILF